MSLLPATTLEPHTYDAWKIRLGEEDLTVLDRVYFPEVSPEPPTHLAETQKAILAAIMIRHHSGYQREIWAAKLTAHPSPWTTPFLALLLGDYVQEILTAIEQNLTDDWLPFLHDFATKNPVWRRSLNHRIVNYWDLHYRRQTPKLTNYPGYKLAAHLGLWDSKTAPKLMREIRRKEGKI